MRLAVYNVENLFDRAKIMNGRNEGQARKVLDAFSALNSLLDQVSYSEADKVKMLKLIKTLGIEKKDEGKFVILRQNRGQLIKRPRTGPALIAAEGRADWSGSLELIEEPVDDNAMLNTARVMVDLEADVLGVVEAEDRPALASFNKDILPAVTGKPFRHVMVIDGNDTRGIDVGILSREGFRIDTVRSHVDDLMDNGEPVFSRDCPEFTVHTKSGNSLVVMVNHLKSKRNNDATADKKRTAQATQIAKIYAALKNAGVKHIAVIGDLNDLPASKPLAPLLANTDLKDAFKHPKFDDGGFPGTYDLCNASNKIDYMLLSPALFSKVQAGGVFRKGMWPGSRPPRWEKYETIKKKDDAASDHAALWVDLDI